jgi:hypothetical protein
MYEGIFLLVCSLFTDNVSADDWMIVNNELDVGGSSRGLT